MTDLTAAPTTVSRCHVEEHEQRLNDLIAEAVRKEGNNGRVRLIWDSIRGSFSSLPRREICHDYAVVKLIADRTAQFINFEDSSSEMVRKKHDWGKIQALLTLASRERNLAQAWTLVNLADALLPFVVDKKELEACEERLHRCDAYLPEHVTEILKSNSQTIDPYTLHCKQLARGWYWNIENRKVSLKLSILRSFGICLLTLLVLVIFIAESAFPLPKIAFHIPFPFLAVTLFGLFGGALSSVLIARRSTVSIPSYELIRDQIFLRMLIGAAGAFVVFVAVESGLIGFMEGITNPAVFLIFGIASGFSEQLFVTALDRIGSKVNIVGNSTADSSTA